MTCAKNYKKMADVCKL